MGSRGLAVATDTWRLFGHASDRPPAHPTSFPLVGTTAPEPAALALHMSGGSDPRPSQAGRTPGSAMDRCQRPSARRTLAMVGCRSLLASAAFVCTGRI